jgi:hypothetical protein
MWGVTLYKSKHKAMSRPRFDSRQGQEFILFVIESRTALGPAKLPIQWVPGALSLGESSRGVKLTTHLHLVPRLRIREAIPPLPHVYMSWRQTLKCCLYKTVTLPPPPPFKWHFQHFSSSVTKGSVQANLNAGHQALYHDVLGWKWGWH